MKTIAIISPDPEARHMLGLAFELEGWTVKPSTSLKGIGEEQADAVLLDMVEGMKGFSHATIEKTFSKAKLIAIAPRGMHENGLEKKMPYMNFIVRRPYELSHLVRSVGEIVSSE